VAQGKSNREIGELMHISSRTADNRRGYIMEKFDVGSVVELVLACTGFQLDERGGNAHG